jgi:hypothetical protein
VNQNVIWNGTLTALHGYNGTVNLSCAGTTPATCSVNPSSLVPNASGAAFTVTVGNATAASFSFSIQGTDGITTHSQSASLTIGTDVNWIDTGANAGTVEAGDSAVYSFSAAPAGAATFTGAVNFTCSNLPALTTCAFTPPTIAAGAGTTAVTLTIATTGPYSGRSRPAQHSRPTHDGRPRHPEGNKSERNAANVAGLLVLTISGFLFAGGRPRNPHSQILIIGCFAVLASIGLLVSCGGVSGGGSGGQPPPATVSVTPGSTSLYEDEPGNTWPSADTQQQFSATVNNGSSQTVTWAVTGGSANGTIDANGMYTAPSVKPNPATVTITATSSLANSPGSAAVTLKSATPLGTSNVQVTATAAGGSGHSATVALTVD